MDVLSDVIASVRAGEPGAGRVEWRAPWGVWFPADPGTAGLLVVLRGSCWLVPGTGDRVPLGVGDVVFAPRGDPYGLADGPSTPLTEAPTEHLDAPGPYSAAVLGEPAGQVVTVTLCGGYRIAPGRTHPLLRELPDTIHLPARYDRRPELRMAVETLGAELEHPRMGVDAVVPVLLDLLLVCVMRAWFDEQPARGTTTGWAAALADPAIRAALDALHHDPAGPWTVAALAGEARLSRAAFARRFTALTGQPPLTYLTWWRMTRATDLLGSSDAPLGEVAARVGYSSEFAFATAFKRQHGVAPGRYRRRVRDPGPRQEVSTP